MCASDAAIVSAIVYLAHSLGIEVVAEGVEDVSQLASLAHIRWTARDAPICHRAQGYLFSRPLAAGAATTLLEASKGRSHARAA